MKDVYPLRSTTVEVATDHSFSVADSLYPDNKTVSILSTHVWSMDIFQRAPHELDIRNMHIHTIIATFVYFSYYFHYTTLFHGISFYF